MGLLQHFASRISSISAWSKVSTMTSILKGLVSFEPKETLQFICLALSSSSSLLSNFFIFPSYELKQMCCQSTSSKMCVKEQSLYPYQHFLSTTTQQIMTNTIIQTYGNLVQKQSLKGSQKAVFSSSAHHSICASSSVD